MKSRDHLANDCTNILQDLVINIPTLSTFLSPDCIFSMKYWRNWWHKFCHFNKATLNTILNLDFVYLSDSQTSYRTKRREHFFSSTSGSCRSGGSCRRFRRNSRRHGQRPDAKRHQIAKRAATEVSCCHSWLTLAILNLWIQWRAICYFHITVGIWIPD